MSVQNYEQKYIICVLSIYESQTKLINLAVSFENIPYSCFKSMIFHILMLKNILWVFIIHSN